MLSLVEGLESRMLLSTTPLVGVNLEGVHDWSNSFMFVDAMKSARPFGSATTPWDESAPVDANGWPTGDAGSCVITVGSPVSPVEDLPAIDGTYKFSATGDVTVAPVASNATIANWTYNATTNTTTADVVVPVGATTLYLSFTGQVGGAKNIKLIRPGYAADTTQVFTNQFLAALAPFQTLRLVDYSNTINNPIANWSDRALITDALQSTSKGACWEYAIQLANQANKDLWINLPTNATDDYVLQLANLLKGSLNAGRAVYLEYGDELWNGAFQDQYQWNYNAAQAEEAANPSILAYDGSTNTVYYAWRRIAERLVQITNIFESVYGAGALDSVFRPVLANQLGAPSVLRNELNFVSAVYGAPANYFYGIAGAPYVDLGAAATDPNLTVDGVFAALNQDLPSWQNSLNAYAAEATYYGLHDLMYEGGNDITGDSSGNFVNAKLPANYDLRMGAFVQQLMTMAYSSGVEQALYYNLASRFTVSGTWGLTSNIYNLTESKYAAIQSFASQAAPALTAGAALPPAGQTALVSAGSFAINQWGVSGPGSGDYALGAGTSLDYLLKNPGDASYQLAANYYNTGSAGQIQWLLDDQVITTVNAPTGGSSGNYLQTASVQLAPGNIAQLLSPGLHTLRLYLTSGSITVSSLAITAPAAVPTGLVATANGTSEIDLAWQDLPLETGYILARSPDGSSNWQTIAQLPANTVSYADQGLSAGTRYYYRLQALYNTTVSAPSTTASTITVPPAPTNVQGLTVGTTQVNLSWADATGESGFTVQRSSDGQATWQTAATLSAGTLAWSDTGLTSQATYYYRIYAVDSSGTSAASSTFQITTPATALAAPTGLKASNISTNQLQLRWSKSAGVAGYRIERSLNGIIWSLDATVAGSQTSFLDTNLTSGTLYYYRVYAVAPSGGLSLPSNVLQVVTKT